MSVLIFSYILCFLTKQTNSVSSIITSTPPPPHPLLHTVSAVCVYYMIMVFFCPDWRERLPSANTRPACWTQTCTLLPHTGKRDQGFAVIYYPTYNIIMNNFVQNSDGEVVELHCHYHPHDSSSKPKSYIHWVSDPTQCTVRLYDKL